LPEEQSFLGNSLGKSPSWPTDCRDTTKHDLFFKYNESNKPVQTKVDIVSPSAVDSIAANNQSYGFKEHILGFASVIVGVYAYCMIASPKNSCVADDKARYNSCELSGM
jgi:hypothetical protein